MILVFFVFIIDLSISTISQSPSRCPEIVYFVPPTANKPKIFTVMYTDEKQRDAALLIFVGRKIRLVEQPWVPVSLT